MKMPETYNEYIRQKNVSSLLYNFELSEEDIEKINDFLAKDSNNKIVTNTSQISFYEGSQIKETITRKALNNSFDAINLNSKMIYITPHYTPSSYSYSGGSSSNNNNNNNNNNNR